jgi:hypothetical protein
MTADRRTDGRLDHEVLADYLQAHLVAAASGERLFEQAAKVREGSSDGSTLAALKAEISSDKSYLESLLRRLGSGMPPYKRALAALGAQVSRLDPLNPFRSPGGATGHLELEGLISAVRGKAQLWETLVLLSDLDRSLDAGELERLRNRAYRQIEQLEALLRSTAFQRFTSDGTD